jgi:hypothetical protein
MVFGSISAIVLFRILIDVSKSSIGYNDKYMAEAQNIIEKHRDGSVTRRFVCECGNSVYRKNFATDVIEFISRKGTPKNIRPLPTDNVSKVEIFCESCGRSHIVAGIVENITISDDPFIHTPIAKEN